MPAVTGQLFWLFVLAMPIASIAWTVTHEELFAEPRDWFVAKSKSSRHLLARKAFYLFTCEVLFQSLRHRLPSLDYPLQTDVRRLAGLPDCGLLTRVDGECVYEPVWPAATGHQRRAAGNLTGRGSKESRPRITPSAPSAFPKRFGQQVRQRPVTHDRYATSRDGPAETADVRGRTCNGPLAGYPM